MTISESPSLFSESIFGSRKQPGQNRHYHGSTAYADSYADANLLVFCELEWSVLFSYA